MFLKRQRDPTLGESDRGVGFTFGEDFVDEGGGVTLQRHFLSLK